MKLWGFDHGASGALRSCFKLAYGALTAFALAWTAGPAHAVTYTFQNIIDPLNPTFTQALGINTAGAQVELDIEERPDRGGEVSRVAGVPVERDLPVTRIDRVRSRRGGVGRRHRIARRSHDDRAGARRPNRVRVARRA